MAKRTAAIVTGAAGGIGKEFVRELDREPVDEIWALGRSAERLEELKRQYGEKIIPVCGDLTDNQHLMLIGRMLKERDVCVSWLVNNAGAARMAASKDFEAEEIERTIRLNCCVSAVLANICIPFMRVGSKIVNVSSASAFQPVPFLNLYAAAKSFEHSYSRALHVELKSMGITVTAVSPSWVDTGMLSKEINGKKVRFYGMVSPERVARQAVKDAKMGKEVSVCSLYVKLQQLNVKLMPHSWVMKIWMQYIRKYM